MKNSFRTSVLVSAFTMVTLLGAAHQVKAQECTLPVCDVQQALDDFKSMKPTKRAAYIDMLITGYVDNTDLPSARNLLDFVTKASDIVTADTTTDKDTLKIETDKIATLLDQSNTQIAIAAPVSTGEVLTVYPKITSASSRFKVVDALGKSIPSVTVIEDLKTLRTFFGKANEISTAAKDPDYMLSLTAGYEAQVNNRMIELKIAPTDLALPIADIATATATFKALGDAERFVLINALIVKAVVGAPADVLTSLIEFSTAATGVIATADKSQLVINTGIQNGILYQNAVQALMQDTTITLDAMNANFARLGNSVARYTTLQFFASKVATETDVETLKKYAGFFKASGDYSKLQKDDAYIALEADNDGLATEKRIIVVATTAPTIDLPITDMNAAVAKFTALDLPFRDLVIKTMTKNAESAVTANLVSMHDFAKAVVAVVTASGDEQKFILDDVNALISQTTESLARAADLTASDLAKYYKQLGSQASRYAVLKFWSPQIATVKTKADAQRLQRFFNLAKTASFTMDDEDYIVREAEADEIAAKDAAGKL